MKNKTAQLAPFRESKKALDPQFQLQYIDDYQPIEDEVTKWQNFHETRTSIENPTFESRRDPLVEETPDYMFFELRNFQTPDNLTILSTDQLEIMRESAIQQIKQKLEPPIEKRQPYPSFQLFEAIQEESSHISNVDTPLQFQTLIDGSSALILQQGSSLKLNLREIIEGGDAKKSEREEKKRKEKEMEQQRQERKKKQNQFTTNFSNNWQPESTNLAFPPSFQLNSQFDESQSSSGLSDWLDWSLDEEEEEDFVRVGVQVEAKFDPDSSDDEEEAETSKGGWRLCTVKEIMKDDLIKVSTKGGYSYDIKKSSIREIGNTKPATMIHNKDGKQSNFMPQFQSKPVLEKKFLNEYSITLDMRLLEPPPPEGLTLLQTCLAFLDEKKKNMAAKSNTTNLGPKTTLSVPSTSDDSNGPLNSNSSEPWTVSRGECIINQMGLVGACGSFGGPSAPRIQLGVWTRVVVSISIPESSGEQKAKGSLKVWVDSVLAVSLQEEAISSPQYSLDLDALLFFSSPLDNSPAPRNIVEVRTIRVDKKAQEDLDVLTYHSRDRLASQFNLMRQFEVFEMRRSLSLSSVLRTPRPIWMAPLFKQLYCLPFLPDSPTADEKKWSFFAFSYILSMLLENDLFHKYSQIDEEFDATSQVSIQYCLETLRRSIPFFLSKQPSESEAANGPVDLVKSIKTQLNDLSVGQAILVPFVADSIDFLILVEKSSLRFFKFVVVQTTASVTQKHHSVQTTRPPVIETRPCLVLRDVIKRNAIDEVFWMSVLSLNLPNRTNAIDVLYEILVPFLTEKPLSASISEGEEAVSRAARAEATDADRKLAGEYGDVRPSTTYVDSFFDCLFESTRYLIRTSGCSFLHCQIIEFLVHSLVMQLLVSDLNTMTPSDSGARLCRIGLREYCYFNRNLLDSVQNRLGPSDPSLAFILNEAEGIVEDLSRSMECFEEIENQSYSLPRQFPALLPSPSPFDSHLTCHFEPSEFAKKSSTLQQSYVPIDFNQIPTRVQTLDSALSTILLTDRLCTLIENQGGNQHVKNDKLLTFNLIQDVFTRVIPLPKPLPPDPTPDQHRSQRTTRRKEKATHESTETENQLVKKRALVYGEGKSKKETKETPRPLTVDEPPLVDSKLNKSFEKEECLWDQSLTYSNQVSALEALHRITEHFVAASLSLPLTSHQNSVSVTVLTCLVVLTDCLVRKSAVDFRSEVGAHLNGRTSSGMKLGVPGFGISFECFVKQSSVFLLTSPELAAARSACLDYFHSPFYLSLEKIFHWEENVKLLPGKPLVKYLRMVSKELAVSHSNPACLLVDLPVTSSPLVRSYPELKAYRDVSFWWKYLLNPNLIQSSVNRLDRSQAQLSFQWDEAEGYVVQGFGGSLRCLASDNKKEFLFSTLTDPNRYFTPSLAVPISTEDDVLYLKTLPSFADNFGHSMSQRDSELFLSYLTVPYLQLPLLLTFFSTEDRIHRLLSTDIRNILDCVVFEQGPYLLPQYHRVSPSMVPTPNSNFLGTSQGVLFNELHHSPEGLFRSLTSLCQGVLSVDTGSVVEEGAMGFNSSATLILYIIRLLARIDNYLSYSIQNYSHSENKSHNPDLLSVWTKGRSELKKYLDHNFPLLLEDYIFKLSLEITNNPENDMIIDRNNRLACDLHAHLLLLLRNIPMKEIDSRISPLVINSFLYLNTRHSWTSNLLVPDFELYEILHTQRRNLVTWLSARKQGELNLVLQCCAQTSSAPTGSLRVQRENINPKANWSRIQGPRSSSRWGMSETRLTSVDAESPVGELSERSVVQEIDLGLGLLTMNSKRLEPLRSEIASLYDFKLIFGSATVQASLSLSTELFQEYQLVGLDHVVEFWPKPLNSCPKLPVNYTRNYDPATLFPTELWIPTIFEEFRLQFLTTQKYKELPDLSQMKLKMQAEPLSVESESVLIIGTHEKMNGQWKLFYLFRKLHLLHVFEVLSHGPNWWTTLVYSNNTNLSLRSLNSFSSNRKVQYPQWTLLGGGSVFPSGFKQTSLVADFSDDNEILVEGMKVEVNYNGRGKFLPGRIVKERLDGTYDIEYDDGGKESRVLPEMIRSASTSNLLSTAIISRHSTHPSNLSGSKETFIPARFLFGIVPDLFLETHLFWKDEIHLFPSANLTRLRGYPIDKDSDDMLIVEIDNPEGLKSTLPTKSMKITKRSRKSVQSELDIRIVLQNQLQNAKLLLPPNSRVVESQGPKTTIQNLQLDQEVEADYDGSGTYWPCVVRRVNDNGSYDLEFVNQRKYLGIKKGIFGDFIQDRGLEAQRKANPQDSLFHWKGMTDSEEDDWRSEDTDEDQNQYDPNASQNEKGNQITYLQFTQLDELFFSSGSNLEYCSRAIESLSKVPGVLPFTDTRKLATSIKRETEKYIPLSKIESDSNAEKLSRHVKDRVLLNPLAFPSNSDLFKLLNFLTRIEKLSHISLWFNPNSPHSSPIELIEFPRLKLNFEVKSDPLVGFRFYNVEQPGLFICDDIPRKILDILKGVPHYLVLSDPRGELKVIIPAYLPIRPEIASEPLSSFHLYERPSKDLTEKIDPYFIYPVHISQQFLQPKGIDSAFYLLVLKFLNRDYSEVIKLVPCVASDTPFDEQGVIFCEWLKPASSDPHPDAIACRLILSSVCSAPFPWKADDINEDYELYLKKLPFVSAYCRLELDDELRFIEGFPATNFIIQNRKSELIGRLQGTDFTVTFPPRSPSSSWPINYDPSVFTPEMDSPLNLIHIYHYREDSMDPYFDPEHCWNSQFASLSVDCPPGGWPIVAIFYTLWSKDSHQLMNEKLPSLLSKYSHSALFMAVQIRESSLTEGNELVELARSFRVESFPTIIFLRGTTETQRMTGLPSNFNEIFEEKIQMDQQYQNHAEFFQLRATQLKSTFLSKLGQFDSDTVEHQSIESTWDYTQHGPSLQTSNSGYLVSFVQQKNFDDPEWLYQDPSSSSTSSASSASSSSQWTSFSQSIGDELELYFLSGLIYTQQHLQLKELSLKIDPEGLSFSKDEVSGFLFSWADQPEQKLEVGCKCEVKTRGGKWKPCKVSEINEDKSLYVELDEDEDEEIRVESSDIPSLIRFPSTFLKMKRKGDRISVPGEEMYMLESQIIREQKAFRFRETQRLAKQRRKLMQAEFDTECARGATCIFPNTGVHHWSFEWKHEPRRGGAGDAIGCCSELFESFGPTTAPLLGSGSSSFSIGLHANGTINHNGKILTTVQREEPRIPDSTQSPLFGKGSIVSCRFDSGKNGGTLMFIVENTTTSNNIEIPEVFELLGATELYPCCSFSAPESQSDAERLKKLNLLRRSFPSHERILERYSLSKSNPTEQTQTNPETPASRVDSVAEFLSMETIEENFEVDVDIFNRDLAQHAVLIRPLADSSDLNHEKLIVGPSLGSERPSKSSLLLNNPMQHWHSIQISKGIALEVQSDNTTVIFAPLAIGSDGQKWRFTLEGHLQNSLGKYLGIESKELHCEGARPVMVEKVDQPGVTWRFDPDGFLINQSNHLYLTRKIGHHVPILLRKTPIQDYPVPVPPLGCPYCKSEDQPNSFVNSSLSCFNPTHLERPNPDSSTYVQCQSPSCVLHEIYCLTCFYFQKSSCVLEKLRNQSQDPNFLAYESAHPILENTNETIKVSVPGSDSLCVLFHPDSWIEENVTSIQFLDSDSNPLSPSLTGSASSLKGLFPGVGIASPLIIPSSSFSVVIQTKAQFKFGQKRFAFSSEPKTTTTKNSSFWGYKFVVFPCRSSVPPQPIDFNGEGFSELLQRNFFIQDGVAFSSACKGCERHFNSEGESHSLSSTHFLCSRCVGSEMGLVVSEEDWFSTMTSRSIEGESEVDTLGEDRWTNKQLLSSESKTSLLNVIQSSVPIHLSSSFSISFECYLTQPVSNEKLFLFLDSSDVSDFSSTQPFQSTGLSLVCQFSSDKTEESFPTEGIYLFIHGNLVLDVPFSFLQDVYQRFSIVCSEQREITVWIEDSIALRFVSSDSFGLTGQSSFWGIGGIGGKSSSKSCDLYLRYLQAKSSSSSSSSSVSATPIPLRPSPSRSAVLDPANGWSLVRRVAPGPCWHPQNDRLSGSSTYGSFVNDSTINATFSRDFMDEDFDEFLFITGDEQIWMIVSKNTVRKLEFEGCQKILSSSSNLSPQNMNWVKNRIQMKNPLSSTPKYLSLYQEDGSPVDPALPSFLVDHNGANVFIRKNPNPENLNPAPYFQLPDDADFPVKAISFTSSEPHKSDLVIQPSISRFQRAFISNMVPVEYEPLNEVRWMFQGADLLWKFFPDPLSRELELAHRNGEDEFSIEFSEKTSSFHLLEWTEFVDSHSNALRRVSPSFGEDFQWKSISLVSSSPPEIKFSSALDSLWTREAEDVFGTGPGLGFLFLYSILTGEKKFNFVSGSSGKASVPKKEGLFNFDAMNFGFGNRNFPFRGGFSAPPPTFDSHRLGVLLVQFIRRQSKPNILTSILDILIRNRHICNVKLPKINTVLSKDKTTFCGWVDTSNPSPVLKDLLFALVPMLKTFRKKGILLPPPESQALNPLSSITVTPSQLPVSVSGSAPKISDYSCEQLTVYSPVHSLAMLERALLPPSIEYTPINLFQISSPEELHYYFDHTRFNLIALLLFSKWCLPSQSSLAIFRRISKTHPSILFLQIESSLIGSLAQTYSISALPTVLLFSRNPPSDSDPQPPSDSPEKGKFSLDTKLSGIGSNFILVLSRAIFALTSRETIQSSSEMKCPDPDFASLFNKPLLSLAHCIQSKVRSEFGLPEYDPALPFDLSAHQVSRSEAAESVLNRISNDMKFFSESRNTLPIPKFQSLVPNSIDSIFIDETTSNNILQSALKTTSETIKNLHELKQSDQILIEKLRRILDAGLNFIGGPHSQQTTIQARFSHASQRATKLTIELFLSSLLSTKMSSDLQQFNPHIPQSLLQSLIFYATVYQLIVNRVGQTNRCISSSETLEKLLSQLLTSSFSDRVKRKETWSPKLIQVSDEISSNIDFQRTYFQYQPHNNSYSFDPRFLIFEFLWNIQLRSQQIKTVLDLRESVRSGNSKVKQMIMGAGKTSVVAPLLALMLADGQSLLMSVVPKALLDMSRNTMRETFSSIITKRVFTFDFGRSSVVTSKLCENLKVALRTGGIVVSTPLSLKSLMLVFLEASKKLQPILLKSSSGAPSPTSPQSTQSPTTPTTTPTTTTPSTPTANKASEEETKLIQQLSEMSGLLQTLQTGIMLLDEVDMILHPLKSELNFPIGEKHPLSGSEDGVRWGLPLHLLDAIFFAQGDANISFQEKGSPQITLNQIKESIQRGFERKSLQRLPHVILLDSDFYHSELKLLMATWGFYWIQQQHFFGLDEEEVVQYLLNGAVPLSLIQSANQRLTDPSTTTQDSYLSHFQEVFSRITALSSAIYQLDKDYDQALSEHKAKLAHQSQVSDQLKGKIENIGQLIESFSLVEMNSEEDSTDHIDTQDNQGESQSQSSSHLLSLSYSTIVWVTDGEDEVSRNVFLNHPNILLSQTNKLSVAAQDIQQYLRTGKLLGVVVGGGGKEITTTKTGTGTVNQSSSSSPSSSSSLIDSSSIESFLNSLMSPQSLFSKEFGPFSPRRLVFNTQFRSLSEGEKQKIWKFDVDSLKDPRLILNHFNLLQSKFPSNLPLFDLTRSSSPSSPSSSSSTTSHSVSITFQNDCLYPMKIHQLTEDGMRSEEYREIEPKGKIEISSYSNQVWQILFGSVVVYTYRSFEIDSQRAFEVVLNQQMISSSIPQHQTEIDILNKQLFSVDSETEQLQSRFEALSSDLLGKLRANYSEFLSICETEISRLTLLRPSPPSSDMSLVSESSNLFDESIPLRAASAENNLHQSESSSSSSSIDLDVRSQYFDHISKYISFLRSIQLGLKIVTFVNVPVHKQMLNLGFSWLSTLLPYCLGKINRVSYGILSDSEMGRELAANPSTPKGRLKLAVPFIGKDVPSKAAEFAHPDIIIGLTILAFRYSGLRKADYEELVDELLQDFQTEIGPQRERPSNIRYESWVYASGGLIRGYPSTFDGKNWKPTLMKDSESQNISIEIIQLKYFRKSNGEQMDNLFRLVHQNASTIHYFLQTKAFPKYTLAQKLKLSASGQSIGGDMIFGRRVGFSGTPSDLLPIELGKCDYVAGDDGMILSTLLNPLVCSSRELDMDWDVDMILKVVATSTSPQFHSLIDTGALITGYSNLQIAQKLLEYGLEWCEGVVFLDEEDRKMVLLRGSSRVLTIEQCGVGLEKRFAFYDQIHTTGMDIKHIVNATAALTLGKDMLFRDYAQGAYRMRGLGSGQRLQVFVIPEIKKLISTVLNERSTPSPSSISTQNQTRTNTQSQSQVLTDVVSWLIVNSLRSEQLQWAMLCLQNVTNLYRKTAFQSVTRQIKETIPTLLISEPKTTTTTPTTTTPTTTTLTTPTTPPTTPANPNPPQPPLIQFNHDEFKNALSIFEEEIDFRLASGVPDPEPFHLKLGRLLNENNSFLLESQLKIGEEIINAVKLFSSSAGASNRLESEQEREQEQEQEQFQEIKIHIEEIKETFIEREYSRRDEKSLPWDLSQLSFDPSENDSPFYPLNQFKLRFQEPLPFNSSVLVSKNFFHNKWTGLRRVKNVSMVMEFVSNRPLARPSTAIDLPTELVRKVHNQLGFHARKAGLSGYLSQLDLKHAYQALTDEAPSTEEIQEINRCFSSSSSSYSSPPSSEQLSSSEPVISLEGFQSMLSTEYLFPREANRFYVAVSLREAETLRRILHLNPTSNSTSPRFALRYSMVSGNPGKKGDGGLLFDSNSDWKKYGSGASSYQSGVAHSSLRFFDGDMFYSTSSINLLIQSITSSILSREKFFFTMIESKRRLPKRWQETPLSKLFLVPNQWITLKNTVQLICVRESLRALDFSLWEAFSAFDFDNSGSLSVAEFFGALKWLNIPDLTAEDVADFIESLDSDGNGTIEYSEYMKAMESLDDLDHPFDPEADCQLESDVENDQRVVSIRSSVKIDPYGEQEMRRLLSERKHQKIAMEKEEKIKAELYREKLEVEIFEEEIFESRERKGGSNPSVEERGATSPTSSADSDSSSPTISELSPDRRIDFKFSDNSGPVRMKLFRQSLEDPISSSTGSPSADPILLSGVVNKTYIPVTLGTGESEQNYYCGRTIPLASSKESSSSTTTTPLKCVSGSKQCPDCEGLTKSTPPQIVPQFLPVMAGTVFNRLPPTRTCTRYAYCSRSTMYPNYYDATCPVCGLRAPIMYCNYCYADCFCRECHTRDQTEKLKEYNDCTINPTYLVCPPTCFLQLQVPLSLGAKKNTSGFSFTIDVNFPNLPLRSQSLLRFSPFDGKSWLCALYLHSNGLLSSRSSLKNLSKSPSNSQLVRANQWSLITVSVRPKDSEISIYLNGCLVQTETCPQSQTLELHREFLLFGGGKPFQQAGGKIRRLMIHEMPLSSDQIQSLNLELRQSNPYHLKCILTLQSWLRGILSRKHLPSTHGLQSHKEWNESQKKYKTRPKPVGKDDE